MIPKHLSWRRTGAIVLLLGLFGCGATTVSETDTTSTTTVPGVVESAVETEQVAQITPAPPDIAQEVWQYLSDERQKFGLCGDHMDVGTSQSNSEVYQVGDQKYLVQLLCFMAAYQGSYQYVLYESSVNGIQVVPLSLSMFQTDDSGQLVRQDIEQVGGLPTFDPGTQKLTIFTKARGVGDCGSYAQYQWKGNEFELLEYRAKLDCDGQSVAPETYPQIYPEQ